jgi:eukaryotic-like serine/threonine-protein kinase
MFKKLFSSIIKSSSEEQESIVTKTSSTENVETKYKIGETFYPFGKDDPKPYGFRIYDIKSGGMGIVYLAYNIDNYVETGDRSAIKTFQDWCFFEPEIVERFSREAEVWIKLGHHHNIVTARAFFKVDNRPYILMEFVDGYDLRYLLKHSSLSVDDAIKLARQFCLGMAHAQDIFPDFVHRDIKPENCLINNSGILKVTDFGLVKAIQTEQPINVSLTKSQETSFFKTQAGQGGMGTFPYMAPEQFEDFTQTDTRTDVYSFGVMFYEMLTGRRPFAATNFDDWYYHHKNVQPVPPHSINNSIPKLLSHWVMQCLEKNPSQRLPDFKALWVFLSASLSNPPKFEAVPISPKSESANSIAGKARSLHQLGKHEEALNLINQAINISDSDWLFWSFKGAILADLGKTEEALYCFDKVISLNPNNTESFINKAKLSKRTELFYKCFSMLPTIYRRNKTKAPSNIYKIIWSHYLMQKFNRNEEALRSIEEAIDLFPQNDRLHIHKADILSDLRRENEASQAVDEALKLNPKDAYILFYKGMYLQNEKKHREALNYFETALELNSSDDKNWKRVLDNAWEMKGS